MKSSPISILEFKDYRSFIRQTLAHMKAKNSQFSLRAFAGKLKMQPSFLSEFLNGKKNLSLEKALQVGRHLGLSSTDTTYLCYLIALESCQDEEQKLALRSELDFFSRNKERDNLSIQYFEIIAQWECIAIFELMTVYPDQNEEFYAVQLSIAKIQAERALAALLKLKLIKKTETGYQKVVSEIFVSSKHHHLALKMYHSSMLEKARHAIYEQSPLTRYTGTETLMIDPELIPEAHKILNESLDRLLDLFRKSSQKSSLVHVQVNLFELNKKKKEVS